MSVKKGTKGVSPNWIKDTNFLDKKQVVDQISKIMVYSPRDWSEDPELWAIYVLIHSDTTIDAQETWENICDDPTTADMRLANARPN
jgi:hypothetical protein